MIADTALLSVSPIVLIDEIENAGIDRRNAVKLLVKKEKLVLISTHDPVLALIGDKRIVIKNGGISRVIILNRRRKTVYRYPGEKDKKCCFLRNHIRMGGIIDDSVLILDGSFRDSFPSAPITVYRQS
jgi:hypothetical protein